MEIKEFIENIDFGITIDFDKTKTKSSDVFRAMTSMLESFDKIDRDLLDSIGVKIEVALQLEKIENGSIKTFFKYVLENVDDEALKTGEVKKIIGSFLVNAKHRMLAYCNNNEKIEDKKSIERLQKDIYDMISDKEIVKIPAYSKIPLITLAEDLTLLSSPIKYLSEQDQIIYENKDSEIIFNKDFEAESKNIEKILSKNVINNTQNLILKVKQPDYLGQAQWSFRHGRKPFNYTIEDKDWLEKFQKREIEVLPGDSLHIELSCDHYYDENNELLKVETMISKVYDVISAKKDEQLKIDF